jgi:hypothetical protein
MDNFIDFLNASHDYIHALGTITPYEAYFTINLNNQIAKVKEQYQDNPEGLTELVKSANIDLSMGLKNIKSVDIDFNTAWYKESPIEMSQRVSDNLAKGFHVSPEILELHINYLDREKKQTNDSINAAHDLLGDITENINELAIEHKNDWKVYAKIIVNTQPPTLPGKEPPPQPWHSWVEVNEKNPIKEPDKIVELMIDAGSKKHRAGSISRNENPKKNVHDMIKITDTGILGNLSKEQLTTEMQSQQAIRRKV